MARTRKKQRLLTIDKLAIQLADVRREIVCRGINGHASMLVELTLEHLLLELADEDNGDDESYIKRALIDITRDKHKPIVADLIAEVEKLCAMIVTIEGDDDNNEGCD